MAPPIEQVTSDGYDMQFGTNVIGMMLLSQRSLHSDSNKTGHWYFAKLLIPALLRGKATSPDQHARIITTCSSVAYFTTLHWDTFKDGPERKKLGTQMLYAQSKFVSRLRRISALLLFGIKRMLSGQRCCRPRICQTFW